MNAKDEFIKECKGDKVLCATILLYKEIHNLTTGWDNDDLDIFLNSLDVNYNDGYGHQYLYGTIWYENGEWSTRSEYDGSEWWVRNTLPPIPDFLIRKDKERNIKLKKLGI